MNDVILYRLDDEESLKHYGVVGMKWGQKIFGDKYEYKSMHTKRQEKKLAKVNKKIEKALAKRKIDTGKVKELKAKKADTEVKVEAGKSWDKAKHEYSKQISTGSAVAKRLISGFGVANAYEKARAAGYSNKAARAHAIRRKYDPFANISLERNELKKRENAIRAKRNRNHA